MLLFPWMSRWTDRLFSILLSAMVRKHDWFLIMFKVLSKTKTISTLAVAVIIFSLRFICVTLVAINSMYVTVFKSSCRSVFLYSISFACMLVLWYRGVKNASMLPSPR
jgi:hypothetical protein